MQLKYNNVFYEGDRVEAIVDHPAGNPDLFAGDQGTVLDDLRSYLRVKWDKHTSVGHDSSGLCEYGYGWNVYKDEVKKLEDDDTKFEFDEDELKSLIGV